MGRSRRPEPELMEYEQVGPLGRVKQSIRSPGVPKRKSMVVRFMEKVEIAPGAESCWEWRGSLHSAGYGFFRSPTSSYAHRASYEIFVGPIPDGLTIDHLCSNRACVKPDHLEVVTQGRNSQRAAKEWTLCDELHPTTRTRLRQSKSQTRPVCQECIRVRYYQRRHAAGESLPSGRLRELGYLAGPDTQEKE